MLLQRLSDLTSPSAFEDEVREFILTELKNIGLNPVTDALGNVLVTKGNGNKRVLLTAHMDEVGLMISSIEKNGLLRFQEIGGIDQRFLVSKPVVIGDKKVPGVIGAKAIHLQEPEERNQALKLRDLYIDIGAKNKEDAEKVVSIGDFAAFDTAFEEKEEVYLGKAFDDRAGCAILLELLKEDFSCQLNVAFTTQEEVGLRGAMVAAKRFDVDMAIVVEATAAHDAIGAKHTVSTRLHHGPAITTMDNFTIASPKINSELIRVAKENELPYQIRGSNKGGNDAGVIHLTREGIPTTIVSVPCRYIHTPVSYISKSDYQNTLQLLRLFLKTL